MDDLRQRFAALDQVPVPDVWSDVERRVEALSSMVATRRVVAVQPEWQRTPGGRSSGSSRSARTRRTIPLLIAAALTAVLIGSAIAVGSGVVRLPALVPPAPSPMTTSPSPSSSEATPSPTPAGPLGGGVILAHSWTRPYAR